MRFYEYVHRDSFVHKLDPRAKLIWLICFSCLVFLTSNPYYYNSNLDFYFTYWCYCKTAKKAGMGQHKDFCYFDVNYL